jgi:hypothetical protein
MFLQSGYHSVPRRRMLWQEKPDCWNKLVAEAIRRDDVDSVLKCLHFRDSDGYFKVSFYLLQFLWLFYISKTS